MRLGIAIGIVGLLGLTACSPPTRETAGPIVTTAPASTSPPAATLIEAATQTVGATAAEIIVTPETPRFPVWVQEGVVLAPEDFGVAAGKPVADATAAQLSDGAVRLYVFAQDQGIRSALTRDGRTFTVEEGARISDQGFGMPRVAALEGSWLLLGISMGGIGSAHSRDGLDFQLDDSLLVTGSAHDVSALSGPSIVAAPQGGWRMYYSDLPLAGAPPSGHTVFSAYSDDLVNWTPDPDFRFGAADNADTAHSAEHPFVLRDDEGLYWMFFFRQLQIWTAISVDGITWTNEQPTALRGNDPDVIVRPNGEWWMYYGDFDPQIGGYIQFARRVWSTWQARAESAGGGPGYFSFRIVVEGASEKPIAVTLESGTVSSNTPLPESTNRLPLEFTIDVPMDALAAPGGGSPALIVSDGVINQRVNLSPPPPE